MGDISLDMETLSTGHDAAIVQIGLVRFDRYGAGEIDHLSLTVSRHGQSRAIDQQTLEFHAGMGGAPDETAEPDELIFLPEALEAVRLFIGEKDRVWAKGPSFDCVILRHAFAQHGKRAPWHVKNERCVRTALDQLVQMGGEAPLFRGRVHDALCDARHQARIVQYACERARR